MKNIELLISKLEKEVGPLNEDRGPAARGTGFYAFEFLHNHNTLKIILIEAKPNIWVIHYELTKENPLLLKKIARICERIERIREGKKVSFILSDDLNDILNQNMINIAIKSCLQNLLMKFSLFNKVEIKTPNVFKNSLEVEINRLEMENTSNVSF